MTAPLLFCSKIFFVFKKRIMVDQVDSVDVK